MLDSNVQLFRIVFLNPFWKSSQILFQNRFQKQPQTSCPIPCCENLFYHTNFEKAVIEIVLVSLNTTWAARTGRPRDLLCFS
ncbi:hypothetical protein CH330_04930 [candidate division WOR-3 bacterium JGI_Cruoil_03_51_56]|uniref:Uncharacterized protein n=1 Tax=candidate division WOR-3 bacterium JGI_Cruoil_03_51_56 TaxID=1973747 RepID=A0A235BU07_UNCW3|nr:MAG: hypothetical protein CH330_04930 [candidate division WOR-3 bacterium JGI_Cruoil_03_51_56]